MSVLQTTERRVDLAAVVAPFVSLPSLRVRDLTQDSRSVVAGDAFVAVAGRTTHGVDHIPQAVSRGAIAVLWDPEDAPAVPAITGEVTSIPLRGLRQVLGVLADRFYGSPSDRLEIAGITGTNGKTTCAWLYALAHGRSGAYLGTLGLGRPGRLRSTTHTTMDVISVHRALRELADDGAHRVGMEVSSHALDQERVAGVRIPVTAFTNLSRDHLDYHGTMEAYGAAKAKLFEAPGVRQAVINIGDAFGRDLARRMASSIDVIEVCAEGVPRSTSGRYVSATRVLYTVAGIDLQGESHLGAFRLRSPLVGAFNAENALLVLGLLLAEGMPLEGAVAALSEAVAPPGRMETFRSGARGPTLVVDYAHTPDALAKALAALRPHTHGALWCVFGCGGDRDVGKRPLMGAVAEQGADRIVLTDDNPRTENPETIIASILSGMTGRIPHRVERDRETAIRGAVREATAGDVILIAGKGHEDYQIYGREQRLYSDRAVALDVCREAA
jgi:UDP-N-acetylmuramoyl-L-alanyl-D-glutamate--2,6-diaminopimelate ligase